MIWPLSLITFWDVVFFIITAIITLYLYISWNNDHWKKRKIFSVEPSIILNMISGKSFLGGRPFHLYEHDLYRSIAGYQYGGFIEGRTPILMIRDPDLIRQILIKDFDHFVDRRSFKLSTEPYLNNMLTALTGQHWKNVRSIMTPAYTSGKMKRMLRLVNDCGEQLVQHFGTHADNNTELEMKDIFTRYTMDVIASTAFGFQSNSILDPDSEFVKNANKLMNPSKKLFIIVVFMFIFGSKVSNLLRLRMLDSKAMDFFVEVIKSSREHREKNNIRRDDFLQLMLDAKRGDLKGEAGDEDVDKDSSLSGSTAVDSKAILSDVVIVAQSLLFLMAGFEPTATLLNFAAYELAINPDVQEKLREEVAAVCEQEGGCTYDGIQKMQYLDRVVQETLRKHPPGPRIERKCTADYVIEESNVTIEKGTTVSVSVIGLHHDPRFFPNPNRFDPDRFLPEAKADRSPYVYLPFGTGPRNCIGLRFAQMEAKVALVHVIRNFVLKPCERTVVPPVFAKFTRSMVMAGGTWLKVERVKKSDE